MLLALRYSPKFWEVVLCLAVLVGVVIVAGLFAIWRAIDAVDANNDARGVMDRPY